MKTKSPKKTKPTYETRQAALDQLEVALGGWVVTTLQAVRDCAIVYDLATYKVFEQMISDLEVRPRE